MRKVFRVHGAVRAPSLQLLQRLSGVFEDVVIDELDLTARRQERDKARDAVDDQARGLLT